MADRPRFRPDLEGLRGVAILLVVLFHAGVPGLAGGFVGVDVFFVLSGFFITGLLAREFSVTGNIQLSEFWGRRALRLLPPLLVVLVATLGCVMVLYAPVDRAAIAGNARWVALYSGNIEFAQSSVDYFSSGENPLLHTWSLAVEEQFYLLWPFFFLLAGLIFERRGAGDIDGEPTAMWRIAIVLAVAGAVSLAASLWLTVENQPWAFYGMPTRVWEFAIGGVLATMITGRTTRFTASASLLPVVGLGLIALAGLTYNQGTSYPGVAAFVPALAAVLLILGGHHAPENFGSRLLAMPWLRWFGRMSYAWYLWHWPLVGLGAVLNPQVGALGRLAWSALALVFAALTYRFIEGSARNGRLSRIPEDRLAPLALGASVAVALFAFAMMRVADARTARPDQQAFVAARDDRLGHDCWETSEPCVFGDAHATTTVVLLGDSHAQHWLGALDRIGKERGWKVVVMVKGGCPVADMPELTTARRRRYYENCAIYRETMVRRIIAMKPAAAILASWDHYITADGTESAWHVTADAWRRGLHRTYLRLSSAGIRTVAVRDVPHTPFDVPTCLSRRAAHLPFAAPCEYDRAESLLPVAIAAQNDAVHGTNVRLVDMNDQICPTARCGVTRNGAIVFTDDNHLTASFSRSVAPLLGDRLALAVAELGGRLP